MQDPSGESGSSSPASRVGSLQAELWLMGQAPKRCTITKVGDNNLVFLTLSGSVDATVKQAAPDDLADIVIFDKTTEESIRLRATISTQTRDRLVLEPLESSLHLIPIIQKALQGDDGSASAGKDLAHLRRSEILTEVKRLAMQYLTEHYASFYSVLDDELFKAAAGSRQNQGEYFDAIKLLDSAHGGLEYDFIQRVSNLVSDAAEPDYIPAHPDYDEDEEAVLALIGKEEFENWLSLQQVAVGATKHNEQELDWLAARFSNLAQQMASKDMIPMGPAWLCRVFGDSIDAVGLSLRARQVIYAVFRDTIMEDIGELIEALNKLFIRFQILPNLEQRPEAQVADGKQSTPSPERVKTTQAAPDFGGLGSTLESGELYSAVRSLFDMRGGEAAPPLAGNQQYASIDQVVDLLVELQDELINTIGQGGDINQQLRSQLTAGGGKTEHVLSQDMQEVIGLIENLFNTIIENEQVAEEAKPILRQLEIPMLKTALVDDGFFTDQEHPARQSLNILAKLCRETHFSNSLVKRRVQEFSDRITQEYSQNPEIFAEVLGALRQLAVRQQQAYDRNMQRVAETLEGQYKLNKVHMEVEEQLYQRYAGKRFPRILVYLLNDGWRNKLVHVVLKHGADSEEWKQALQLLHTLYAYFMPEDELEGQARPDVDQAKAAAVVIENQVESLGINPFRYRKTIDTLRALVDEQEEIHILDEYPDFRQNLDEVSTLAADIQSDRWHTRCQDLQAGNWLGWLDNPEDEPIRLAWVAEDHSSFVFVNEQGHQLFNWTIDELADKMEHGFQVVSDPDAWPVVDEGLYEMVQAIYEDVSQRTGKDELTGLFNRTEFERHLAESTKLASYSKRSHSLISVDIDQFGLINQYQGHEAGDALLAEYARVLRTVCPANAVLARIAGNEFVVLLPNQQDEDCTTLAESLRLAIEEHRFNWEEQELNFTASLGALMVTDKSSSTVTLLKQLASATLQAKESGGNQVFFIQDAEEHQRRQEEMLTWVTRLGTILEQDLLRLRCQQIVPVDSKTGKLHYEILLGVVDENGQVTPPGELIAAAEHYNRMDVIDRWVVQATFSWCCDNPERYRKLGGININLSGNSINNDQFLNFLLNELDNTQLPTEDICFELTETATIANLPKAADFIERVKEKGCKFALDDFGTGLSSFEYLKKLPVDYVKIDGIFVKELHKSADDRAMVEAINHISHFMGKQTIAEFVENEEILLELERIGVDYAQGYGVAKPTLLDDA